MASSVSYGQDYYIHNNATKCFLGKRANTFFAVWKPAFFCESVDAFHLLSLEMLLWGMMIYSYGPLEVNWIQLLALRSYL